MSTTPRRRRVACACGKTLLYLIACPPDAPGATQIDCGRCQYLAWRLYRSRGEELPKRALMVLHTISHAGGTVTGSEVLVLTGGAMRARPISDLRAAIEATAPEAMRAESV